MYNFFRAARFIFTGTALTATICLPMPHVIQSKSSPVAATPAAMPSAMPAATPVMMTAAKQKSRYYFEARGEAIWDVPTNKKAIAITFDDGPNPLYTPKLLKLLSEYHAHATFFVIGSRVSAYPELVRQEVEQGHEIGNHTFHHHNIKKMSQEELEEEIEQTQETIQRTTGKTPVLFRPPTGIYNREIINAAKANHCLVVIWSWDQDTRDWGNASAQTMIPQVLGHLHAGDIILFHDKAGNRKQTLQALSAILPAVEQRGYECLTVSELLKTRSGSRVETDK